MQSSCPVRLNNSIVGSVLVSDFGIQSDHPSADGMRHLNIISSAGSSIDPTSKHL